MLRLGHFERVVVFTGAGMSAESGVPTYRGRGGIWNEYNYEDYACELAFQHDPDSVLDFHELRRSHVLTCVPHAGHLHLAALQRVHPSLNIITQNIDGMHQRVGTSVAAELHGSLWRQRCAQHGRLTDTAGGRYRVRVCPRCGQTLRPDITWFGDGIDQAVFATAQALIDECDLFIAIGTAAIVWPAAGLIPFQRKPRPWLVEINPEETEVSDGFDDEIRQPASKLSQLLKM
ncbi:NAD-dependent deacylase [Sinimarinibacterium sp. CAU 1509]|nr:NAD-dependent deacylase [Sinimarinibacterium sp. CAU 1509]